jgi:membrane associated rhomboid family serine protease
MRSSCAIVDLEWGDACQARSDTRSGGPEPRSDRAERRAQRGTFVVAEGSEGWLRLGPTTVSLSLLNALVFVALTVNADLVDVLGLPGGWGELAQQPWTALTVMFTSGHVAHLLVAVAVIAVAGGALERRVGSVQVLAIYLLSVSPPASRWRWR